MYWGFISIGGRRWNGDGVLVDDVGCNDDHMPLLDVIVGRRHRHAEFVGGGGSRIIVVLLSSILGPVRSVCDGGSAPATYSPFTFHVAIATPRYEGYWRRKGISTTSFATHSEQDPSIYHTYCMFVSGRHRKRTPPRGVRDIKFGIDDFDFSFSLLQPGTLAMATKKKNQNRPTRTWYSGLPVEKFDRGWRPDCHNAREPAVFIETSKGCISANITSFGMLQVGNPLIRSKEQCCHMYRSQKSASLKPGFLTVSPGYKHTVSLITITIMPWPIHEHGERRDGHGPWPTNRPTPTIVCPSSSAVVKSTNCLSVVEGSNVPWKKFPAKQDKGSNLKFQKFPSKTRAIYRSSLSIFPSRPPLPKKMLQHLIAHV